MSRLTLRLATSDDISLVWRCRQELVGSPAIQGKARDDFAHHEAWMRAAIVSSEVLFLIPMLDAQSVGYVRFNHEVSGDLEVGDQSIWRTSISIRAEHRGHGVGAEILQLACAYAQKAGKSPQIAVIHRENIPSQRLFARCGFTPLSLIPDADGYSRYIRATSE